MKYKFDWQEKWETINFDFEYDNDLKLEISNFGRVKSTSKFHKDRILKGSMINGYKIIKLKFTKNKTAEFANFIFKANEEIKALQKKIEIDCNKEPTTQKSEDAVLLEKLKKRLANLIAKDVKQRTIYHQFLVHRMVAKHFLPAPPIDKNIVAHKDYNKLNNHVDNLCWMDLEENIAHQQKSPHVLESKLRRLQNKKQTITGLKLNSTQVIHIKLLLKKNKNVKELAKKFKVSEMQIRRIKSGENWSHVTIPE